MPDLQLIPVRVYRRVSVREAKTGSASLDWQQQACASWIAAQPGAFVVSDHCDDGVSAGKAMASRSAGRTVAQLSRAGETVLVARLDRGWRDVLDFRRCLARWQAEGVRLCSATEPYDLDTAGGLLSATIVVAVAEYERRTIGERIQRARQTRRATGQKAGTPLPYGYRYVEVADAAAKDGKRYEVVANPDEQAAAEMAWQLRMRGKSWGRIAKELDREGIKPRHSKRWSRHSVRLIVEAWERGQKEPKKGE